MDMNENGGNQIPVISISFKNSNKIDFISNIVKVKKKFNSEAKIFGRWFPYLISDLGFPCDCKYIRNVDLSVFGLRVVSNFSASMHQALRLNRFTYYHHLTMRPRGPRASIKLENQ